ncbi:uncharacterized protein LOC142626783 [Castanea sativa]|uniref:uncharacterized protein LOC142626783 n=1 Tax=Castanea sativa TaxID=21020 RepID=UPI003F652F0A
MKVATELFKVLGRVTQQQRSRVEWLKSGDLNTSYFHSRATHRNRRNFISKLVLDDGASVEDEQKIGEVLVEYFKSIFTSANPSNFDTILQGIEPKVTPTMNAELTKSFKAEEVEQALKQMKSMIAPGPDGMPPLFYKSYWDTVSSDVINAALSVLNTAKLGFDEKWIALISTCIRTVSFSVLVNGEPHGLFQPNRGLRQGDPLSPYLFILCAEGFHSLIKQAENAGSIRGVSLCKDGPKVSHLFFADDSLLFCRANEHECQAVLEVLEKYEQASGQQINWDKT